jgi:hypothetical protein
VNSAETSASCKRGDDDKDGGIQHARSRSVQGTSTSEGTMNKDDGARRVQQQQCVAQSAGRWPWMGVCIPDCSQYTQQLPMGVKQYCRQMVMDGCVYIAAGPQCNQ